MKRLKKIILTGSICLIVLAYVSATLSASMQRTITTFDAQNKTEMAVKLNAIIQQHADKNNFSGSVLVARSDQILLSEGYGFARRYIGRTQNTPDTKFLLGSMTKTFTALAILQLEQDHLIRLDDTVTQYFPEYTQWSQVTIHHLLNHTSGIPNYYETAADQMRYYLGHTNPIQIMDRQKDKPLLFNPGSDFDYSNTNYMILTAIIEQVTEQPYIDTLKTNLLEPIGMASTGYSEYPGSVDGMARSYCLHMYLEVTGFNLSNFYGAGGLYSTTEDLYRLQQNIDFDDLINERSMQSIDSRYYYGYGMMYTPDEGFGRAYFISGGGPGINTLMYHLPDSDTTVILLTNSQDALTDSLAQDLFRAVTSPAP